MKRLTFPLLFLCLFVSTASAQNATIAAWNIEGFTPIDDAKARRLARVIGNLQPDVILLTEVNPNSVVNEISGDLNGYRATILNQTASQNIAILSKNAVTITNVQLIPGSDDGNPRLRKALAANIRVGQFDFILIGVHMKAGRPKRGSSNPQPVRTRQAQAIEFFIRRQLAAPNRERDVLLVGDYNMIPGQDNVNFAAISPGASNNEFLRFISSELGVDAFSHINMCTEEGAEGNLLDGFAISRRFTREFIPNTLAILDFDNQIFGTRRNRELDCEEYRDRLSDHLPLVAFFRTTQDDD
jgi:endonuclease/exonuclease/phosphatase family metal-dependent hydrolase